MKTVARALAVVLSLGAVSAAEAADEDGEFAVFGPGVRSCAEFRGLVDSNARDALLYIGWFQGYLSRANLMDENVYSALPVVDANSSATLLYRVCANNPSVSVERAADSLIKLMAPMAVPERSEIVRITEGERTLEIWQATLIRIQEQLWTLGHYQGEADGLFGPGTKQALIAFQKEQGLNETGLPDIETLAAFLKIFSAAE